MPGFEPGEAGFGSKNTNQCAMPPPSILRKHCGSDPGFRLVCWLFQKTLVNPNLNLQPMSTVKILVMSNRHMYFFWSRISNQPSSLSGPEFNIDRSNVKHRNLIWTFYYVPCLLWYLMSFERIPGVDNEGYHNHNNFSAVPMTKGWPRWLTWTTRLKSRLVETGLPKTIILRTLLAGQADELGLRPVAGGAALWPTMQNRERKSVMM